MLEKTTAAYQGCIKDGHKPTGVHIHVRKEKTFIGKLIPCLLLHTRPTSVSSVVTTWFQTWGHKGKCLEPVAAILSVETQSEYEQSWLFLSGESAGSLKASA